MPDQSIIYPAHLQSAFDRSTIPGISSPTDFHSPDGRKTDTVHLSILEARLDSQTGL
jgi:hypothetical protein